MNILSFVQIVGGLFIRWSLKDPPKHARCMNAIFCFAKNVRTTKRDLKNLIYAKRRKQEVRSEQ